ncbi:MAG: ABC transporter substrate-binding protein [Clostridia bacterium]|nr:ABC transporter substrate-binding protein [Clostridia bacterium]
MKAKVLAVMLSLCLLTGCYSLPNAPSEENEQTNTLNVCSGGETNPLNPQSKADKAFFDLLYDPLFLPDNHFEPQCILAEHYSFTDNRVTVHLRPDLFFSDGTALDASDVIKTVRTLKEHPEYVYAPAVENIDSLTSPDEKTINFTLKRADAFFVEKLFFPILPSEQQTGIYPAGTGAYRLASAMQNEHLFEINEFYRNGAPAISTLRLHILPDGETVRYAFRSGTVDALYTQARHISDYSGVGSVVTPFESMKLAFVGYRADHPLLQHRTVRQAISRSIDRQKLVDTVLMGYGTPTAVPLQPNHYRFADAFEQPLFDVESAKEKLTAFLSSLEEPVPPTFTLLVNGEDAASVNLGVSMAGMLASCGLNVHIDEQPFATYHERVSTGDFDAYLGQVDFFSADDAKKLVTTEGILNYGSYQNEETLTLFENLRSATNETALQEAVTALTSFLDREQPILSICFEQDLLMSKESVQGEKTPLPEHPFFGATAWNRR